MQALTGAGIAVLVIVVVIFILVIVSNYGEFIGEFIVLGCVLFIILLISLLGPSMLVYGIVHVDDASGPEGAGGILLTIIGWGAIFLMLRSRKSKKL